MSQVDLVCSKKNIFVLTELTDMLLDTVKNEFESLVMLF